MKINGNFFPFKLSELNMDCLEEEFSREDLRFKVLKIKTNEMKKLNKQQLISALRNNDVQAAI